MTASHTTAPAHSVEQPPIQREAWWVQPTVSGAFLAFAVLYVLWVAFFQPFNYFIEPYVSPFYSPVITIPGLAISPALLVGWIPGLFRVTCYYYRKAYYRAFFWDPPACAIAERGPFTRRRYGGEAVFPTVLLNSHRYFLYLAIPVLAFLWVDTYHAFVFQGNLEVHLGSLLFLAQVVFLSLYVLSCHSLRHLFGGGSDCFNCDARTRVLHGLWRNITLLNAKHGLYAWLSLAAVLAVDIYLRLLMAGLIADPRIV